MLVEAELDFATAMLGLPADPRFAETRQRPLAFLTQAREDLRGCVSVPLPKPGGPVLARRPRCWQQRHGAALVLRQLLSLQVATEAPSHQPSGKLRHWLQKLQMAKKTVSQASRARGFRGVTHHMVAGGLLHPGSGANPPFLPTTGD